MPDLVFELGCEELPASQVDRASAQLASEVVSRLEQARLSHGEVRSLSTPRRLILGIFGIQGRQEDEVKRMRGPAAKAAFGPDGSPTKALEGFCRGQGVDPSQVEVEGDYVWVAKLEAGRTSAEVLAEALPESVRALTFDKTMRWGSGRMRFSRPIRWILAVLDGVVIPFEIEGVPSGAYSRGHRFASPGAFEARTWDGLVDGLRARAVEPDPARREESIRAQALAVSHGRASLSDDLVRENVHLTEWPTAHVGEFREEFLSLPDPVLVTAMAKHEKFFPVRGEDGRLTRQFVAIRNHGDEDAVKRGNAWVLNNRFNDAEFFHREDAALTMHDLLARLDRMTFQDRLGSMRQKADRLAVVAAAVAEAFSASPEDVAHARQAGLYSKADLASGLVGELASLQGVVGGDYARRDGFPEPVCAAIASQYRVAEPSPNPVLAAVVIADQLDKLAGFLGIGLAPSGTSDPFALRRAAGCLIEWAWAWHQPLPDYQGLFTAALDAYAEQGIELNRSQARESLESVMEGRYDALVDVRYDLRSAAVTSDALLAPRRVRTRLNALGLLAQNREFLHAAVRTLNIASAAEKKGMEVQADALEGRSSLLNSPEEEALVQALRERVGPVSEAVAEERAGELARLLAELQPTIHQFFEKTMVMSQQEDLRSARLSLVAATRGVLLQAGDLTQIVQD